MRAKIWFPERQILEEYDVNEEAASSIDEVETIEIDGAIYLLNASDDPEADFVATRKGVA
ncbi:MAG: hypothetical protein E5X35_15150 [Mesorhizobium sp.]|uniref:hypothetical protein n=1 Tax=Mesorhizobium sp. TaxID=1871066 RepID=UPI0011FF5B0A|nr:hypothetical protein [Mesorhizobium sp.]TIR32258.1 MAG: hypothetical protein E5X35_15150 [Mesorhizobium sp.]